MSTRALGYVWTAGDGETVAVGDTAIAEAGAGGKVQAGWFGELRLRYYDAAADRFRTRIGYIGEGGLLPDTAYRLNADNEFEVVP